MVYTVHEVARMAGVSAKTLRHYHKIGLLAPQGTTEAGYRIYGDAQIKRLQQILIYRELEFPLADIKRLLAEEQDRLHCLQQQYALLQQRQQRLGVILHTLGTTIAQESKGEPMSAATMFQGLSRAEWQEALAEQNEHLKQEYGYDMLAEKDMQPAELNEQAQEAIGFMAYMREALQSSRRPDDPDVRQELARHLAFPTAHGIPTDAQSFAAQTRFFLSDDFHRNMLESQQTGLSYYLFTVAELYAAALVG